jgi:hypothetical protein
MKTRSQKKQFMQWMSYFPIPKPTNGNSPLPDDEPALVDATRAAASEKSFVITRWLK